MRTTGNFLPTHTHPSVMHAKLRLLCLALLTALLAPVAFSQSFSVTVSQAFAIPPYLTMNLVSGTILEARFTSAPYVRKVASTNDVQVGIMTYGLPPQIMGHASVVFQYYPDTHTINIFPGTTHITTWFGDQQCRVYENGQCSESGNPNPNWQVCSYPGLAPYKSMLVSLSYLVRFNTIRYLRRAGYTVTENDAVLSGSITAESLRAKDAAEEMAAVAKPTAASVAEAASAPSDALFIAKAKRSGEVKK